MRKLAKNAKNEKNAKNAKKHENEKILLFYLIFIEISHNDPGSILDDLFIDASVFQQIALCFLFIKRCGFRRFIE